VQKLALITAVVTLVGGVTETAKAASKQMQARRQEISQLIGKTWHMQRVMGSGLSPTTRSYETAESIPYIAWVKRHWLQVRDAVRRQFQSPPHYREFLCIHNFEGSWRDSGSPYWGGLQMDVGFQSAYGGYLLRLKGTADHWTPLEQIWTAEKAHRSRGFGPWPNTARYCGLL
jgi:hypothetical protein